MVFNAEIRRADYVSPGIPRTSTSTLQSNITVIELRVEQLQKTIAQEIYETPRVMNPSAYLVNRLQTKKRITMTGRITGQGNVPSGYFDEDLDYAQRWWGNEGPITLVYTHEGVTRTLIGFLETYGSKILVPEEGYQWNGTFVSGTPRSN